MTQDDRSARREDGLRKILDMQAADLGHGIRVLLLMLCTKQGHLAAPKSRLVEVDPASSV